MTLMTNTLLQTSITMSILSLGENIFYKTLPFLNLVDKDGLLFHNVLYGSGDFFFLPS